MPVTSQRSLVIVVKRLTHPPQNYPSRGSSAVLARSSSIAGSGHACQQANGNPVCSLPANMVALTAADQESRLAQMKVRPHPAL